MAEAQIGVTWPVLRRGATGSRVKTLQYLLHGARDEWQSVVAADGIFGPKTEETVRAYQGAARGWPKTELSARRRGQA